MFDFRPTSEQSMLIETVKRFAEEKLYPAMRPAEEMGHIPDELIQQAWEIGLLQSAMPEAYGGFGDYSVITMVLGLEQFAYGDLATTFRLTVPNLFAIPILLCGTATQKEHYLPHFVAETPPRLTAALTEETYQFDPRRLSTVATTVDGGYLLSGAKIYVPDALDAEAILIYASAGNAGESDPKTEAFIVPAGSQGLTIGPRDRLMGIQGIETYRIELDDVFVPNSHKIGEGDGIDFDCILSHSRVAQGGAAVGMAQAALDYTVEYTKGRVQFGKPVAQNQSIAFMLADMASDIESMRMLVWEAAWLLDQADGPEKSDKTTRATTLLKRYVDQAIMRIGDGAVQALGGYGYIREYPAELYMRNGRGFPVFDGLTLI